MAGYWRGIVSTAALRAVEMVVGTRLRLGVALLTLASPPIILWLLGYSITERLAVILCGLGLLLAVLLIAFVDRFVRLPPELDEEKRKRLGSFEREREPKIEFVIERDLPAIQSDWGAGADNEATCSISIGLRNKSTIALHEVTIECEEITFALGDVKGAMGDYPRKLAWRDLPGFQTNLPIGKTEYASVVEFGFGERTYAKWLSANSEPRLAHHHAHYFIKLTAYSLESFPVSLEFEIELTATGATIPKVKQTPKLPA